MSSAIPATLAIDGGTPDYICPEQIHGTQVDHRGDLYSVGVLMYGLLTGHVPFRAPTTQELLRQVLDDEPQPPRQLVPHLPKGLEQICLRALAKRIQDRYITAGDMADELNRRLKVRREDVFISLVFVNREDWSFGNGEPW